MNWAQVTRCKSFYFGSNFRTQICPEKSAHAAAYLDFVSLGDEGLLDGPVEVAPAVDDEQIFRHLGSLETRSKTLKIEKLF
jgi:hypothetical protein